MRFCCFCYPSTLFKMTKLIKINLPELCMCESAGKKEIKKKNTSIWNFCCSLPVRNGSCFFHLEKIQRRAPNEAMTAKCNMIYLCDDWLVHIRCDRKKIFSFRHRLMRISNIVYTENPIYSSSFHIPFNLCLCHSHIHYTRCSMLVNKNYCGCLSVGLLATSTLIMLTQTNFFFCCRNSNAVCSPAKKHESNVNSFSNKNITLVYAKVEMEWFFLLLFLRNVASMQICYDFWEDTSCWKWWLKRWLRNAFVNLISTFRNSDSKNWNSSEGHQTWIFFHHKTLHSSHWNWISICKYVLI